MHSFQEPSQPRFAPRSRRKTPPPAFINLDDCKPILSTTTANTSTNSSRNGTTAFVFTSSRTLRALQDEADRRGSPGSPAVSSPATPPTPSSSASSYGARSRAQLTLSQLTKHSEGAIDARSLIGPKMRAAGFVDLPHTLASRSDLAMTAAPSSPSTTLPVSSYLESTPIDPPNLPPIVFVHPSTAIALPIWDYQTKPLWHSSTGLRKASQADAGTASNEDTPSPLPAESFSSFFVPSVSCPLRRASVPQSSGPDSSGLCPSSGSSSTLVSSESPPSTHVEGDIRERRDKGKAKETELSEYPFPSSSDYARSFNSDRSHESRASSATASPTIYAGHAGSSSVRIPAVTSLSLRPQGSDTTKQPSLPREPLILEERRQPVRVEDNSDAQSRPSFAATKKSHGQHQLSLTEICGASPCVWLSKSEMFVPPAPIARSPVRASSLLPTTLSVSVSRFRPPLDVQPHRQHLPAADRPLSSTSVSERHHRIPSEPLRLTTIPSEPVCASPDHDNERAHPSRNTIARGVVRLDTTSHSSCTAADGADIPRWSNSVTAPSALVPGEETSAVPGVRIRGRDTRGKVLGASVVMKKRTAAEETDLELEKTKQGLTALVLAHRERDREYARHAAAGHERDKLVKQKQRVHRKLREKSLRDGDASESEATMVDYSLAPVKHIH
ncbi:hypothetical protein BC628DRAFT_1417115 [Trametes gibbosa]|nr:hypothetical protein BC628DRAFT_1417115 [Trametes gibbosa]